VRTPFWATEDERLSREPLVGLPVLPTPSEGVEMAHTASTFRAYRIEAGDGGRSEGCYAHGRPLSLLACSRRGQPPAIRSSNLPSSLPSGPSVGIP
jgi:hypothetical protein